MDELDPSDFCKYSGHNELEVGMAVALGGVVATLTLSRLPDDPFNPVSIASSNP